MKNDFNAGIINSELLEICGSLRDLLQANGMDRNAAEIERMLSDYDREDPIRIAFVGQYSTGKSSIISALTGNREIRIGADATTDESKTYVWGNFLLTDTPGKQNNETHDNIADAVMKQSDLLVFCITSELFSEDTLAEFRSLAFEKGYLDKIILLVNKINREYTPDVNALIATYKTQLNKDLTPHSLDEIAHCFIDAKDYLNGLTDNDPELIADSRFDSFITLLNDFLSEKGLLCKLSTPILFAKQVIDDSVTDASEDDAEKNKLIALARLGKVIDKQRIRASKEWDRIINEEFYAFVHHGYELADTIGWEDADIELQLQELATDTTQRITDRLEQAVSEFEQSLDEELDEVLSSKIGQFLIKSVSADIGEFDLSKKENHVGAARECLQKLGNVGGQAAAKVKPDQLYKMVQAIGKKVLKIKFKPWGILKAANKLGKALKFLGPAAEVIGIGLDVYEEIKESKEAKKLFELRKAVRSEILKSAKEIRSGFSEQKDGFLSDFYGPVYSAVDAMKAEILGSAEHMNQFNAELASLRNRLDALLKKVLA